jgi:hypothetical protein
VFCGFALVSSAADRVTVPRIKTSAVSSTVPYITGRGLVYSRMELDIPRCNFWKKHFLHPYKYLELKLGTGRTEFGRAADVT